MLVYMFLLQRARRVSCFWQHFRSSFRWQSWEGFFTSAVSDRPDRRGVLPQLDFTAIHLRGVGIAVRFPVSPAVLALGRRRGATQTGKCCLHLSSEYVRGLACSWVGRHAKGDVALDLAISAAFASAALTFPVFAGLWLFPTPSYMWAPFQGMLVTLIGMLLAERAHHSEARSAGGS